MRRIVSKKKFMERLKFYLTFDFDEEECANILGDYEEWFYNEGLQGKNEEEICAALKPPKTIVRNMRMETDYSFLHRMRTLFQNRTLQALGVLAVFFCFSIALLEICNKRSWSYLYAAWGMMFFYFIVGMILTKKDAPYRKETGNRNLYGSNLFALCAVIVMIAAEMFLLPKMEYADTGKRCFMAASLLILGLLMINLYLVVKKMMVSGELVFCTTLHISGVISILLFFMNQSHFMYDDVMEYSRLVYGSIGIYIETILLCLICFIKKVHAKEKV